MCTKNIRTGFASEIVLSVPRAVVYSTQDCPNDQYRSQKGDGPFVNRDGTGWPASLPYIQKICVSVAIGTQSGIHLHERVPIVKIWRSSKNDQNRTMGKSLKL